MCHDVRTQERFYALHKTLGRAKAMREMFVCLSLQRDAQTSPSPAVLTAVLPPDPDTASPASPAEDRPGTSGGGDRAPRSPDIPEGEDEEQEPPVS